MGRSDNDGTIPGFFAVCGVVGLALYGAYLLVAWLCDVVWNWALRLTDFFMGILAAIAVAVACGAGGLFVLDLLIWGLRPAFEYVRRTHRAWTYPTSPTWAAVVEGAAPRGLFDRRLAPLMRTWLGEKVGSVRVDRRAFQKLRTQFLRELWATQPDLLREPIAELFALAQQGGAMETHVRRYAEAHRRRRFGFCFMRCLNLLLGRFGFGWTEPESWKRAAAEKLFTDLMVFERLGLWLILTAMAAAEALLEDSAWARRVLAIPMSEAAPPAPAYVPLPEEEADQPTEPEVVPVPVETTDELSEPEDGVELAATGALEARRLLEQDHEGWRDPDALIRQLEVTLRDAEALAPGAVDSDLREQVNTASRRLPELGMWLGRQLEGEVDVDRWAPAMLAAALEAEDDGELSVASIRRRATRRFLTAEEAELEHGELVPATSDSPCPGVRDLEATEDPDDVTEETGSSQGEPAALSINGSALPVPELNAAEQLF